MAKKMYNVSSVTQRSMPLWPLENPLGDMFGAATMRRLTPMEAVDLVCWAAGEGLIELTSAHDCDLVPWNPAQPEDDLDEKGAIYEQISAIKTKLDAAGVGFHTMTCNLHADPLFKGGGLANPDPAIRDLARLKVERAIRIGARLGARVLVYWVARDGFIVLIVTQFGEVYKWIADALNHAHAYIHDNGLVNYQFGSIEPKPNEPTGHSFIPTAGHAAGFITSPLIVAPDFWKINPELLQHEGMTNLDPITCLSYLIAIEKLGFLHFGNQIRGHEDNDFPPLIGPEGLKETAHMFWLLSKLGWKGVVEFDCHALREDATDNPMDCMKYFLEDCSRGLAIALALAERLAGAEEFIDQEFIVGRHAAGADLVAIQHMCGLSQADIDLLCRRATE